MRRLRSQPRVKGVKRLPSLAMTLPRLHELIRKDAREYGVSPSWVAAVILSEHYHVATADYREGVYRRLRIARRRTA